MKRLSGAGKDTHKRDYSRTFIRYSGVVVGADGMVAIRATHTLSDGKLSCTIWVYTDTRHAASAVWIVSTDSPRHRTGLLLYYGGIPRRMRHLADLPRHPAEFLRYVYIPLHPDVLSTTFPRGVSPHSTDLSYISHRTLFTYW